VGVKGCNNVPDGQANFLHLGNDK